MQSQGFLSRFHIYLVQVSPVEYITASTDPCIHFCILAEIFQSLDKLIDVIN